MMKKLLLGIHHLGSTSGEKTDWPAAASALVCCQVCGSHGPFRDRATVPAWLSERHRLLVWLFCRVHQLALVWSWVS